MTERRWGLQTQDLGFCIMVHDEISANVKYLNETIDFVLHQALDQLFCAGVEMERISRLMERALPMLQVDSNTVFRVKMVMASSTDPKLWTYTLSVWGEWYGAFVHLNVSPVAPT